MICQLWANVYAIVHHLPGANVYLPLSMFTHFLGSAVFVLSTGEVFKKTKQTQLQFSRFFSVDKLSEPMVRGLFYECI